MGETTAFLHHKQPIGNNTEQQQCSPAAEMNLVLTDEHIPQAGLHSDSFVL